MRAAVTVALDATMGAMVDEIARRVLAALNASKPQTQPAPAPPSPSLPSFPNLRFLFPRVGWCAA